MRFTLPSLFALASVAVATAVVKDPNGRAANPTSPNPYLPENQPSLTKRGCFLGILCLGTSTPDYSSDVNNCGQKYKVCSTLWPNGWGSQCSNGVCGPAYCYNLFDFNWLTGKCQDVSSDLSNCGKCGQTCTASSITGASSASCISGTCTASACQTGYTLSSGTCTLNVNTQTDVNNCGTRGNVCQSSWAYGTGRQCLAGICQPVSCSDGFDFNFSTNKCQDVRSDTSNCGKCGNVCSFPNGYGSCSSGSCILSTCRSGFYKVNGVCTSLDLSSDASNCGSVGNDCTSKYPNGVGICSNGNCALGSCVDGYKSVSQTSCGLIFLFCSTTTTCTKVDTSSDSDNCGSIGNKCAASYANGYNPRCSNGACQATCNNGYSWDSSLFYCRATTNDVNNCGECNNRCPSLNGTPQCNNGVCSYASCNTGYYLVNGACTALTLSSDVNNCGAVGTKCPASYPNGNGVTCASGVCRATTCNPGYDWDATTKTCRNVLSDTQNCGRCNNVCSFPNGSGSCLSGSCTLSKCNTGFQNVNGACTSMDITSDVNNCGAVGKVCVFPLGQGTCSAGSCTYTSCNAPYALKSGSCTAVDTNTDVKNCGSIGNVCPVSYNNGGAGQCVNGDCRTTCNAGFDFDTDLNYCRDVTSDVNNCGRCGGVCSLNGAMATKCVYSKCYATSCKSGYYLQGGVCNGIDTTSDTSNCGGIGKVCSFTPTGAVGTCQNSVCTVTSCPAGYIISSNICVKSSASQRARAKKSKITAPKSLCPDNETACPIAGAASYAMAVSHHFSAFGDLTTGMDGAGGFECLDTTQALDSCGGCASTGEGQDCTKIPSAVGVGCDSGACVVFSCQAGWRPNLAGTKCIRAHHQHDSSNSTRSHGSRRHLAARHGHHGHGHS